MNAAGIVTRVSSKDRNTRFGVKKVHSFQIGADWFNCNFKNPNVNVGDSIAFDYEEGDYGKDVDVGSITKSAASSVGMAGSAPSPVGTPMALRPVAPAGGKGVFPIPALDGQRAIVRQNALTNARELVCEFAKVMAAIRKDVAFVDNPEREADRIIAVARKFEAYSCGDLDMKEVEAEMEPPVAKAA